MLLNYLLLNSILIIYPVHAENMDNDSDDRVEKSNFNQNNIPWGFLQARNALDFTGKVALVTGSNSGIGAETVRLFSYLGAQVVVTGRNQTRIRQVGHQCWQLSPKGLRPLEVAADLTHYEDVRRLIDQTVEAFHKIDILVNSAGILVPTRLDDKNYTQNWLETTAINERAVLQVTQLAIPCLNQTKGNIIFLSSDVQDRTFNGRSAYSMSKAALVTLAKTLADELGPRIRVNCVSPNLILNTRMFRPFSAPPPGYAEQIRSTTSLRRNGFPLDIAKGIIFLASPLAEFISAENLHITGGFFGDVNVYPTLYN